MNDLELYDALANKSSATLQGYLDYVIVDSRPPRRLKLIMESWQLALYGLLTPLFESACGGPKSERRAAFVVAPRGFSKTSTQAQLLNWALCYSKRPITATAAAADRDQAQILIDRMRKEASHNRWLAKQLHFKNYQVTGPTGVLDVVSSDAPTATGRLDDILVMDELTSWKKRDLFDVLMSGRNKRRDSIAVIISNAGMMNTWQHDVWQMAHGSGQWITHEVPAFSASWLDKQAIEDDRKLLLVSTFRRMHENVWVSANEEAGFLSRQEIEACIDPLLFRKEYAEQSEFSFAVKEESGKN